LKYLCSGVLTPQKGDICGILTDGFEDYIKLPEFISLFTDWSTQLESDVKIFTSAKARENPEKYGHERSIIITFYP